MKNEYLPEEAKSKQGTVEEQNIVAEDLKFIRSVIEKTYRAVDPGSWIYIVWGLIFLIGYPATQYFLTTPQLYDFILPVWSILCVIAASITIFNGIIAEKREKRNGVISQLSKQISLVWFILFYNGIAWSAMWLVFKVSFGELAFLWAVIFGFGLSIMGILSSKEWLFGGIAIFVAILTASFIKEYAYVILGIVMGLACIIPAIIAKRNYRKMEKENAKT